MTATETGIVVVADQRAATALADSVGRSSRYRVLGRAETIHGVLDGGQAHPVDMVVVDISGPDRLRELTTLASIGELGDAKLVVVSTLPAEAALMSALAAGARAFLHRPVDPQLFRRALDAVVAGECFVDPRSTAWLVELALHGYRSRPEEALTLRQSQVVELVRGGLTNREIAHVLGVTHATVKSHLHDAMRRLGAGDRWAATVLAERLREDKQ